MSESIIVAIISVIGIIISGILSAVVSASLIKYRIEQLEKKVDSHNHYAQMFNKSATDIAVLKNDIKYIKEKLHYED